MEKVTVSTAALRQVLEAFRGPSYMVLELMHTRNLEDNPLNILLADYNKAVGNFNERVCAICDGGPGNNSSCSCGFRMYFEADKA